MSETKPLCERSPSLPGERGAETCPYCGHTAREHWDARTAEDRARVAKINALASARDEVVRAAKAWAGSVSSEERRLYEMELARKVAALAKLEKA